MNFNYFRLTKQLCSAAIAIVLITITGCSEMSEPRPDISEEAACGRMKGLIADHRTQFSHYKKSLRRAQSLNTWSAIKAFPSADKCQIWEWSNGLYNYMCNWPARDGRESAVLDYQQGNAIIKTCLGPEWRNNSKPTKSGGESTVYFKPGAKTIVAIRFMKEARSLMNRWQTVVSIGDKNNLNTKLH